MLNLGYSAVSGYDMAVPRETAVISVHVLCTPRNDASVLGRYSKPHVSTWSLVHARAFEFVMIRRTVPLTARSLAYVCDIYACLYTGVTSVHSLILRAFEEAAQNF